MTDLDTATLLHAYDAQLRPEVPDPVPQGVRVERDGPLVRITGLDRRGFLSYRTLDGLSGDALDELIERQVRVFRGLGQPVEWKLYGHDEPADLPDRLVAAGFRPEERETVVVGPVAPLAATLPVVPDGVRLREVTARTDLDRIAALETEVWDADRSWLADALERELATTPDGLVVVVAEDTAEERVVSAGWLRYEAGTAFASLWGGSTLRRWRGRGIYRALVTYRARLAAARGYAFLQVDASEESRPILERLGLVPITTTTPYVYTP